MTLKTELNGLVLQTSADAVITARQKQMPVLRYLLSCDCKGIDQILVPLVGNEVSDHAEDERIWLDAERCSDRKTRVEPGEGLRVDSVVDQAEAARRHP